jgi:prephenate dehydrogenase
MITDFPNITILGGGLLGGSLCLALSGLEPPPHVRLWARKQETVQTARELSIPGVTSDLADAVRDADLLILAVPVGSMASLLASALEAGLPAHCLVTDVGSVKGVPHRTLAALLHNQANRFIGSHPMAGSERNGIAAATQNLFQNAACLLTNDDDAPEAQASALERFWQSVGCRTSWMTAAAHDQLVARISHLPHILAASASHICLKKPSDGRFGGGGLRDTTRVAAGNPSMWSEIVIENREALTGLLHESITDLREILTALENNDAQLALRWLTTAKEQRDPLNLIS